jgi:hypothetical protein
MRRQSRRRNSTAVGDQLDLDQHARVGETADLDHGGGGTGLAEGLAMSPPNLVAAGDVGYVHAGLHRIGKRETDASELVVELAEDLDRLLVGRGADDAARGIDRRGPGDEGERPGADDSAVAPPGLKGRRWVAREPPDPMLPGRSGGSGSGRLGGQADQILERLLKAVSGGSDGGR